MNILIAWIAQFVGHNGGMDKVFVRFANEMTRRGHTVTLAYCTEHEGKIYTPIHPAVRVINIAQYLPGHKWESHKNTVFKIKKEILRLVGKTYMLNYTRKWGSYYLQPGIQKLLKEVQPDVVVTMDAKATAAIKVGDPKNRYPVITMSHFNAEYILNDTSAFEKKMLMRGNVVQVLMPHDLQIFKQAFPGIHLVYIPNIVPQYDISLAEKEELYKIVNVARLDKKQKRQHLLIEAFAQIANKYPNWKVEFWGEEQESSKYGDYLCSLVKKYHLKKQVFLMGNAEHVIDVYKNADIFAFPSSYEGFPLAMTEAMSAGLPVIAYQSCPAVNELVRNGENGLLVKDGIDALATGLEWLITHKEKRITMGQQAQRDMESYAAERIWDQWEKLLNKVVSYCYDESMTR